MTELRTIEDDTAYVGQNLSNDTVARVTSLSQQDSVSTSLVRAALVLTLAKYANTAEISIGIATTESYYSNASEQQRKCRESVSNLVPVKVQIDESEAVSHYLERINCEMERAKASEKSCQSSNDNAGNTGSDDNDFQAAFIEHYGNGKAKEIDGQVLNESKSHDVPFRLSKLDIHYQLTDSQIHILAHFDSMLTSATEVEFLLDVWQHVLEQLSDNNNKNSVSLVQYVPGSHMSTILQWNPDIPKALDACLDELVHRHVLLQPDAPAICSWDGNFTYAELDFLSTSLAARLVQLSVGQEVFVAYCFDKSAWAIVSILAIIKARGAFVAIDPKHPQSRIETILQASGAPVVLTTPKHSHLFEGLAVEAVEVDAESVQALSALGQQTQLRSGSPTDALYMITTSGSTGLPKSIVVEHRALCSSFGAIASAQRLTPASRVSQFAAYTFDPSIHEIFNTLSYGGCVCVPSEVEKINDLIGFIVRNQINTVEVTPSVAQLLRPEDLPCVKNLTFGGEPWQPGLLEVWAGKVNLWNMYGPSEAVVACAGRGDLKVGDQPNNIGKGLGALLWIVDDGDHNLLCPIGCIGELIIEGPALARGYTNPEQTKSSFIENPTWAKLEPGQRRRFYKTGDLVKYNMDGTVLFIGRKDSQVKISGYRIELGEIEHQLNACDSVYAAVTQFPKEGAYKNQLVAILSLNGFCDPTNNPSQLELAANTTEDGFATHIKMIRESLARALPPYMIPQSWVIVKGFPLNSSEKLDRPMVKRFLIEQKDFVSYVDHERDVAAIENANNLPSTDTWKTLQKFWAGILGVGIEKVTLDSNFFQLGGNSLQAMRLVSLARRENMTLTVANIFSNPVLANMAAHLDAARLPDAVQDQTKLRIEPFELVGGETSARGIVEEGSSLWGISWDLVQDIYPCTPLQSGLISLSEKNPGTYTVRTVFKLPPSINVPRFKNAWEACIRDTDILRSIIVPSEQHGPCQVILKSDLVWQNDNDLESFIARDSQNHITYGSQLNRFALIQDNSYFVWTAHHASYDGVSTALVLQRVEQIYREASQSKSRSIAPLVKHIQSADPETLRTYWKSYLANITPIPFPRLHSAADEALPNARFQMEIPLRRRNPSDITSPTIVRAAWALVLSQYTESEDVIFGATLSGRTAPVECIDEMVGPTVTTVPVRISVDPTEEVSSYLGRIQAGSADMMAFEHVGLQNIGSYGRECQAACDFQNLLVIQPPEIKNGLQLLGLETVSVESNDSQEAQTYPLNVEVKLTEPLVDLQVTYDNRLLTETQVSRIMGQFCHAMQQLAAPTDGWIVGDIDLVSPQDLAELQVWNAKMPDARVTTIAAEFSHSVELYPDAPAVCAWDGEFTYAELDRASSKMAQHLVSIGVRAGLIVPVCFDKSAWAVVAILAIVRAGGAWVALDAAHPPPRLFGIIDDVEAEMIITAPQHAGIFSLLNIEVVAFSPEFLSNLVYSPGAPLPAVSPRDPAFVIFTSGSTGKPKGIVVEHEAVCTSTNAFGSEWGIGPGTRVFQFAAYVFDVSVSDMCTSLMRGACVCVPSENDRMNDTAAAINRFRATYVSMTPTVASLLKPEDVPTLRTLILGGEAPTQDNIRTWAEKVDVILCYGPAECSITCSGTQPAKIGSDPGEIGLQMGSNMWIVDPKDHNKLVPNGCVGEILIEGPILARCYLNDPAKTAAAFIENPTFTKRFNTQENRRFYKTGDLGYYNAGSNGSMNFAGRKDNQVKVRGQRVELGEIEHHIYANPSVQHVVATVPMSGPFKGRLVAMLVADDPSAELANKEQPSQEAFSPTNLTREQTRSYISDIKDYLSDKMPRYMIPSGFIFVQNIPLNTSGKLNRGAVKAWAQAMDDETYQLITKSLEDETPDRPLTEMEILLRQICGRVLKLEPSLVSMGQSFLALGGDSITAMHIVRRCRDQGMQVRVKDILQSKTLYTLATLITPDEAIADGGLQDEAQNGTPNYEEAFDALRDTNIWQGVKSYLGLADISEIEAVYPCTPVQTGMLIAHARSHRFYEINNVFEVKSMKQGEAVDANRLEKAWAQLVERQPVLRTAFYEDPSTEDIFYQAVIKGQQMNVLRLESTDDEAADMLFSSSTIDYHAPKPANQFTICTTPSGRVFAKVDILHALSDGTTWDLIFKELSHAYEGEPWSRPPPSYKHFVGYLHSKPSYIALDYWKTYLEGVQPCLFPSLGNTEDGIQPQTKSLGVKFDQGPRMKKFCTDYGVTVNNLMQAIWGLVLRSYVGRSNVCFGYVVSGRDVPLPDLEEAIGTYITQLPCRLKIQEKDSPITIAKRLQEGYFDGLAHQHVSFVDLYHSLGIAGQLFNSNVHYMRIPDQQGHKFSNLSFEYKRAIDPSEYDITVHAMVYDTDVHIHLGYWDSALSETEAQRLADLLSVTIMDVLDDGERAVGAITSPLDENHISSLIATPKNFTGTSCNGSNNQTVERPFTAREESLKNVWTNILEIDPHLVGLNTKFRGFGGDSFLTIKMVKETRESGFLLNFMDAMADISLSEMAARMISIQDTMTGTNSPNSAAETWASPYSEAQSTFSDGNLSNLSNSTQLSVESTPFGVLLEAIPNDFPGLTVLQKQYTVEAESTSTHLGFRGSEAVEDLLPTTLIQQAMLASQVRSQEFYNPRVVWKVAAPLRSIGGEAFGASWQQVVDSHRILRTIFVRDMEDADGSYSQLVLKGVNANVEYIQADNEGEALRMLSERPAIDCRSFQPAHLLTVCTTSDGHLLCSLSVSHALSDAVSLSIMLNDLLSRCKGEGALILGGTPYTDLSRQVPSETFNEAKSYWGQYLKDSEPCHFPAAKGSIGRLDRVSVQFQRTADLRNFTKDRGLTASTVFRSAWAKFLANWTKTEDVCFGAVVSGRNVSVPGIENMVGPVLDILPCRVKVNPQTPTPELLEIVQDDLWQSLPYQHCSSVQTENAKRPESAMFNTLINFRNSGLLGLGDKGKADFEIVWSSDPMEFDIVLAINERGESIEIELNYWDERVSSTTVGQVTTEFISIVDDIIDGKSIR